MPKPSYISQREHHMPYLPSLHPSATFNFNLAPIFRAGL